MSKTRKGKVEFTAAEVRVLLGATAGLRCAFVEHGVQNSSDRPTLKRIEEKLWRLYAETHPEDGPFK